MSSIVVWKHTLRWGYMSVKLTIIGSDNGWSPGRRQTIIWTNTGILLIGPLGTNFSEISIEIQTFSLKKIRLKMSSAKCGSFRLGLNVLSKIKLEEQLKHIWPHIFTCVKESVWSSEAGSISSIVVWKHTLQRGYMSVKPSKLLATQLFFFRSMFRLSTRKRQRSVSLALYEGNLPVTRIPLIKEM